MILSFAGEAVETARELTRAVAATALGQSVKMRIWRDGDEKTIQATLDQARPQQTAMGGGPAPSPRSPDEERQADEPAQLGVVLAPLTQAVRNRLGVDEKVSGAVVAEVMPGGKAAGAGLRPGDVIVSAGNAGVEGPEDVIDAVKSARNDDRKSLLLRV